MPARPVQQAAQSADAPATSPRPQLDEAAMVVLAGRAALAVVLVARRRVLVARQMAVMATVATAAAVPHRARVAQERAAPPPVELAAPLRAHRPLAWVAPALAEALRAWADRSRVRPAPAVLRPQVWAEQAALERPAVAQPGVALAAHPPAEPGHRALPRQVRERQRALAEQVVAPAWRPTPPAPALAAAPQRAVPPWAVRQAPAVQQSAPVATAAMAAITLAAWGAPRAPTPLALVLAAMAAMVLAVQAARTTSPTVSSTCPTP